MCTKMVKANPVAIQKYLKGVDYPANKQELVEHAQQHGAAQNIISLLQQLPDNVEFANPTELNIAIAELE